jgi:radical SAM superfamily enzyme
LSAETLQIRRKCDDTFKIVRGKTNENQQAKNKYHTKKSYFFYNKCKTKTFSDKQKLRKIIVTRLALQEMLRYYLQTERRDAKQYYDNIRSYKTHW